MSEYRRRGTDGSTSRLVERKSARDLAEGLAAGWTQRFQAVRGCSGYSRLFGSIGGALDAPAIGERTAHTSANSSKLWIARWVCGATGDAPGRTERHVRMPASRAASSSRVTSETKSTRPGGWP